MIWFKKKNAGNVLPLVRLFDDETGHFNPILKDSAQFDRIVVEFSFFAEKSKLRQIRLNPIKLVSCAAQFPIEPRP
jgi:hypothetical protein